MHPELASHYKGMVIKTMCLWLAVLSEQLVGRTTHSKVRCNCMWAMAEFLRTIDHGSVILTADEIQRAMRAGRLYLQSYQWLAVKTESVGQCLWSIVPKMHYFDHVIENQVPTGINPKAVQCDADETFMNTMKRIGSKCHGKSVSIRQVQRYLLALRVRMKSRRDQGHLSLATGA